MVLDEQNFRAFRTKRERLPRLKSNAVKQGDANATGEVCDVVIPASDLVIGNLSYNKYHTWLPHVGITSSRSCVIPYLSDSTLRISIFCTILVIKNISPTYLHLNRGVPYLTACLISMTAERGVAGAMTHIGVCKNLVIYLIPRTTNSVNLWGVSITGRLCLKGRFPPKKCVVLKKIWRLKTLLCSLPRGPSLLSVALLISWWIFSGRYSFQIYFFNLFNYYICSYLIFISMQFFGFQVCKKTIQSQSHHSRAYKVLCEHNLFYYYI